jgi:hypothetical protein
MPCHARSADQHTLLCLAVCCQAGIMLEAVIKTITPKIMTWGQYAEAAYFMYQKRVLKNPSYKRYVPDYTKCADHFALHAGEGVAQAAVL